MSGAAEIYLTGDMPDPSKSTEAHQAVIAGLVAEASAHGWAGAEFSFYGRDGATIAIGIREATAIGAGPAWPGIDELRKFREQQKAARAAEAEADARAAAEQQRQEQQGSFAL